MTTPNEVVRLEGTQIKEAGEVLARAFQDNPMPQYVVPDDAKRARVLDWFMSVAARYGHMYGEVYTTADKVEGGAIWLPPENFAMSPVRMVRSGMILMPLKLGLAAFGRFMNFSNHWEHLHKRDIPRPHWYLWFVGVDPPRQGQGTGSALMQPVVARADADGLPCYLETANARNVPLYERHGFEVVVEDDLPKGGPHFWTMKREPRG
jgi:ribosomal protein S18 acetylase RimI-like enzyme